jgi:hypothetical protein
MSQPNNYPNHLRFRFVAVLVLSSFAGVACAGDWPQFRGPNASGIQASVDKLPAQIGPEHNLIWKAPSDHSR